MVLAFDGCGSINGAAILFSLVKTWSVARRIMHVPAFVFSTCVRLKNSVKPITRQEIEVAKINTIVRRESFCR